jgi:hypothetical protein
MDTMTLLALAQGVFGIGQKVVSGIQASNAKKNFTPYQIPSSVNMMLDKANQLASQTNIPGADIYQSKARSNASQTIENAQRTAGSSSDVMGVLPGVQNNLDNFYKDIAAKGSEFYQQNQAQQQQALNTFGQYETERWRQNEYLPYIQALQTSSMTGQAGNQNIGSAIGAGMAIGTAKWEKDALNKEKELWKLQHGLDGAQANVKDMFAGQSPSWMNNAANGAQYNPNSYVNQFEQTPEWAINAGNQVKYNPPNH